MSQKYVEIWEASKSSREVLIFRIAWQLKIYVWMFLVIFGCYGVLNTMPKRNFSIEDLNRLFQNWKA